MHLQSLAVLLLPAFTVCTRVAGPEDTEESAPKARGSPAALSSSTILEPPTTVTLTPNLPRQGPPAAIDILSAAMATLVEPTSTPVATSSVSSKTSAETANVHVKSVTASFHNEPFVTVQWAETFIGGTYSTWLPRTVSFDFKPEQSVPPAPGRGEIGMGTLTGKTGQTQTVVVVQGAAPTYDPGWVRGIAAVVGIGVAGIV